jgi:hypothetical protein
MAIITTRTQPAFLRQGQFNGPKGGAKEVASYD